MGVNFDCASSDEIDRVLSLGVDSSRIIYANPCKSAPAVRHAAKYGVRQTVFDNEGELYKIKKNAPSSELFLRILVDDSSALCRLGQKYGAPLEITRKLLRTAKNLELNVVGVSFHCGSGVTEPGAFAKAVADARTVFDWAAAIGYEMKTLDVGGGFTGEIFETVAETLDKALTEHFPPSVRIISEPGRYYVSSAFTLACCVNGRGEEEDPETQDIFDKIFINDGLYGNFSSIIFDHQKPQPQILLKHNPSNAPIQATMFGRSCDGIDQIAERTEIQGIIGEEDWFYFEDMGAYTKCCATRFNGFSNEHDVIYKATESGAAALLGYN